MDHSLVAKAHMSVGKAYHGLNQLQRAEQHIQEAVRIFIKTCGDDSPLTAYALVALGNVQYDRNNLV